MNTNRSECEELVLDIRRLFCSLHEATKSYGDGEIDSRLKNTIERFKECVLFSNHHLSNLVKLKPMLGRTLKNIEDTLKRHCERETIVTTSDVARDGEGISRCKSQVADVSLAFQVRNPLPQNLARCLTSPPGIYIYSSAHEYA